MALSRLDNLYRQVILDHSAHPHHHGQLAGVEALEMNNPTCGDVIFLSLIVENGKVKDIAFDGAGCSISIASGSMMTDAVIGKPIEVALDTVEEFSRLVQGQIVENAGRKLGDAAILAGVSKFPARIKCATLAWKALEKALINNQEQSGHDE